MPWRSITSWTSVSIRRPPALDPGTCRSLFTSLTGFSQPREMKGEGRSQRRRRGSVLSSNLQRGAG